MKANHGYHSRHSLLSSHASAVKFDTVRASVTFVIGSLAAAAAVAVAVVLIVS